MAIAMKLVLHKLLHWEYWPTWVIYFPVAFLWLYWIVRWRPTFFLDVNPGLRNGGFCNVSKMEIHRRLPHSVYPRTVFVDRGSDAPVPEEAVSAIGFPLIMKPDFGLRGMGLELIYNVDQLNAYHSKDSFNYLIQEYVDLPHEAGIFFVRIPGDSEGMITGITGKTLLAVVGDGISTIEQLIKQTPRGALQWKSLRKANGVDYTRVMAPNETIRLAPFGNHTRGALFTDESHRINPQLTETINRVCRLIGGFYYGRLDIRFNTWEELSAGRNFRIIEVNGAVSEPTHCYDPKHSYGFAVREIVRHHRYMCRISHKFRLSNGFDARLNLQTFFREFTRHRIALAQIKKANHRPLANPHLAS